MHKLIEDLRIGLLGAAAGLFSSSLVLLIDRIDSYYASLAAFENEDQVCGTNFVHELFWLPLTFSHMVMSVVASFVVHRYLSNRITSPFLLWQTVGITTLLGWGLAGITVVVLQCVVRGNLYPLEHLLTSMDWTLAKYVSVVFACNVFYGSVIDASTRQYESNLSQANSTSDAT
jgi:hypothetical protein